MKNIRVLFIVAFMAVIAGIVYFAMQTGEKSPIIVAGEIKIDAELENDARSRSTFFIILFDASNPAPMPYGAYRDRVQYEPGKPLNFIITRENLQIMNPNMPVPEQLRLKARFDMDGNAGPDQPGDLTGEQIVARGSDSISLLINRKI